MRSSRFTESQIVLILKEAHDGVKVMDFSRRHAISDATYYNWKSKYGGLQASDLKQLKELEWELGQYKRMYAELAHANFGLKGLVEKSSEATGEARSRAVPGGYARVIGATSPRN